MDSRRVHHRAHLSSSDSNSSSPASPSSPALGGARPGVGPGAPGTAGAANAFANDGSFMAMFKKKMEEEKRRKEEDGQASGEGPATDPQEQSTVDKKPPSATSFVGKRRGGVFLKTGMVAKKLKPDSVAEPGKSDAWAKYMAEVKMYKSHQCGDDDKTRPLVK
ncbi:telomerase RNA component interacting RNase [Gadus macrocephalus]|uniref:telomerase RNA component interacting RNase n=1 Tax=Gadus macrocephalus TaxID=80720 RepID=UPI0028CB8E5C|nr:telomerase RNA component interacting RNase [Gadus macrocephalus]